jgi:glycosyltransferase involved in cell wall biosynthesis
LIEKHKPDLLFTDGLPAVQYTVGFESVPHVVDAHDAMSLAFRRASKYAESLSQKFGLLLEARGISRFEIATARSVDAYLVNSPIDQQVLQSYHRDINVRCIPNGVDADYFAPNSHVSDEKTLVFTGVMNYRPNGDAAHFLCMEILPLVKDVIPEAKVQLVGSEPPDDVRALAGNGVVVTGTVPDVRPFVHRATAYVSPLRFGTGVKNKILAALAMGKAVVATPESCAGLDLTPGKHLLLADNANDFATHIVKLFGDSGMRHQLGAAGRNLVVERYGWDVMGRQLMALLEGLVIPKTQHHWSRRTS